MHWHLTFFVISVFALNTNGQRRALVNYHLTSTEDPETVSENPLSSSINSIQTGREELTAYHRGDSGSGGLYRRGYHKATTPPYFKEPFVKGDSANEGKTQYDQPSKPPETEERATAHDLKGGNGENSERSATRDVSSNNQNTGGTIVFKDKRSTGVELPSSSTARSDVSLKVDSEIGSSSQPAGRAKESVDINKSPSSMEQDHRSNAQESRRHTSTPSSAKFNSSGREGSERPREELPEKSHNERSNRERRPTQGAENTRGHRPATRSTSEKGQILTHPSTPRNPTGTRYDRTEQPLVSTSNDRKAQERPVDSRDSFRGDEVKKTQGDELVLGDKVYQTVSEGRSKVREDQSDSADHNKPSHSLGGEERISGVSRNPDVYKDEYTGGEKGNMNAKAGSDIEKSIADDKGKAYAERPYTRDHEERSPGHRARDPDRGYTRRHRDRYDERSYDERTLKGSQGRGDLERNTTYDTQDRTASRSSRPRDGTYDEEYRDDAYPSRDTVKSSDNVQTGRTRSGRRPYSGTADDVDDRDRYTGNTSRNYSDYSDDRRYMDERISSDRDGSRRYRDEDRKYRDDGSRIYDDEDYEDTGVYGDDYTRRREKDGGSKRYRDDVNRRYVGSGSRRYEEDETRRSTDYDRPVRRYKDDDEYTYNDTRRYRDNYDGYRDDKRRSSGESVSSHKYDERDGTRYYRYDDEEYKGNRSYSSRDSDQKYVRRDNEGTLRQRDPARTYATDDTTRYRAEDDDRYRSDTRTYSGSSSSKDGYDQSSRRTLEDDGTTYIGTRSYPERPETEGRREYDAINKRSGSRRTRGDGNYRTYPYAEDDYYNNRTSEYVDRYDGSDRSTRRTDDDYPTYVSSDGDGRRYVPRSNGERRKDRDSTYADIPESRRRSDIDGTRRDTRRTYDDDRRSDLDRVGTYDERSYRDRDTDEYSRGSSGRDYDTRIYRDSDDDTDTRSYRVRSDVDASDRYKGDDTGRDRTAEDEAKLFGSTSRRNRDKDYTDRVYEERYDKGSEGTYRYRDEDERYKYRPSEDRKPEYRDSETRSRGTQRFRDEYDTSHDRDSRIPRTDDETPRGGSKSNRRDDRFTSGRADFDDKAQDQGRSSSKTDTSVRGYTKTEFTDRRNDEPLLKEDRRNPYDDERRRDGRRSHPRDSEIDDALSKARVSEERPDNTDKGDFGRGRRTYYSEDDKADSDRDERGKVPREDRRFPQTEGREETSYSRNDKSRGSTYDSRDSRHNDRSSIEPSSEGRTYSNRRDILETDRRKTDDVDRVPSDLLHASDDISYSDRTEDVKPTVSRSDKETQRRYSISSGERVGRRQLPTVREPEIDRTSRRDESEDSSLLENRGRYRYTKSRGDREDFERPAEDRVFRDEHNVRGGKSSKGPDADRSDMRKGEYGSPGTPTRNRQDRIPADSTQDKDEHYTSGRDKVPSRDGKAVDASPEHGDFDRREKPNRDRDNIDHEDRGTYENSEYHRSSSQEELKFTVENTTIEHSNGETRATKDGGSTLTVVPQTAPGGRNQGTTISRSATPTPYYQDKELISRNISGKNLSDKISGVAIYREKRFQYDDRLSTNNTSRGISALNDELSKRPLTPKEVIDAAYRHSDDPDKQRDVFYPVYVPGSGNMTSPDIIRPSERRGITTPTKKKKKK